MTKKKYKWWFSVTVVKEEYEKEPKSVRNGKQSSSHRKSSHYGYKLFLTIYYIYRCDFNNVILCISTQK